MTAADFNALITSLPYTPTGPNATGIIAPIVRAVGHILYLVGGLAEPTTVISDEEALNELTHALEHWNIIAPTALLSRTAQTHITNFGLAIAAAKEHYVGWNAEDRQRNLHDLAHRAAGLASFLDVECIGLRTNQSNPGSSL